MEECLPDVDVVTGNDNSLPSYVFKAELAKRVKFRIKDENFLLGWMENVLSRCTTRSELGKKVTASLTEQTFGA